MACNWHPDVSASILLLQAFSKSEGSLAPGRPKEHHKSSHVATHLQGSAFCTLN